MNDYKKTDFFTVVNKNDGTKKYYLKVKGKLVEVNKNVYLVCHSSYQKQSRDIKRDQLHHLISLDTPFENNASMLDMLSDNPDLVQDIHNKYLLHKVLLAIRTLKKHDQDLIIELYLNEHSEQEVAQQLNVSQQAISKRKKRIIKKIKEIVKKGL